MGNHQTGVKRNGAQPPFRTELPSQRASAYACLALSMALVGSYVALSKPLVAVFPVFLLAWLRFAIGGVAMLAWLRKPAEEPRLTFRTKCLIFLESFFGNFLFTVCMLYGVGLTSAVSAGIIMATIPAVVALMGWIFLRERIDARIGGAIVCSAMGMALLAWPQMMPPTAANMHTSASVRTMSQALGSNTDYAWLGDLLVFVAVLCEAAYAVIGKKLTHSLSPKRISALVNLWGFALVTPLGAWAAWQFDFSSVSFPVWGLLLFYGLAASVWTVWLWMTGLKTINASRAGVFTVMLPLAAVGVGVAWLHEPVSKIQFLAMGIALFGILVATVTPMRTNKTTKV